MAPISYLISALLLLGLAFVVLRLFVRRDYQRRGQMTPLSAALETLVFGLWGLFTWANLPPAFPPPETALAVRLAGWALMAWGLSALALFIGRFGLRRTLGLQVSGLEQSGPYRISRNPQILACLLAALGYALLWPTWRSLGWVVLLAALAHMMVLTEEEHLKRAFGGEYEQYCRRVPRYLGFPRRI
jgi:protein-S-isoprenylcysteine O-methyltransferase Ste14